MNSPETGITSHRNRLWDAVHWLAQRNTGNMADVEAACQRFDLGPRDEELLLQMWHERWAPELHKLTVNAPNPDNQAD